MWKSESWETNLLQRIGVACGIVTFHRQTVGRCREISKYGDVHMAQIPQMCKLADHGVTIPPSESLCRNIYVNNNIVTFDPRN